MKKLPKIPTAAEIQQAVDDAVVRLGWSEYVEYATYLPQDAAPPADAELLLSGVTLGRGGGEKVEIAVKGTEPLFALLANIGFRKL